MKVKNNLGLCAAILLLSTTLLSTSATAALQKVGVVGAANQTLSAVDEAKSDRKLMLGNDIFFNDTLKTDGSGNAQLMFLDKSALTIGPNSSVVIDKFVYDPSTSTGELTMRGTKGAFRFIGGALSKKKEVQFKTPVGTIGIRGGIAIVEIAPSGATNATFLYGEKMTFQNPAGQISETTKSGFAISLATATSVPSAPVAVAPAALAATIQQNFVSTGSESGGAKIIPTNDKIDKTAITGEATKTDKINSSTSTPGGDNKATPDGTSGNTKDGQGSKDGSKSGNSNTQGTLKQDGSKTSESGTQSEAKSNVASGPEKVSGEPGNTTGTAAAMPRDPGVLTGDGGYVDANGKAHSASDLAAYRLAQANAGSNTSANNNNSGYIAPTNVATGKAAAGGYYGAPVATSNYNTYTTPATGTYNNVFTYGNVNTATTTVAGGGTYYSPTQPFVAQATTPVNAVAAVLPPTNVTTSANIYNYTDAQLTAAATIVRDSAYTRAKAFGMSEANAVIIRDKAEASFRSAIGRQSEIEAAKTVAYVDTTTNLQTAGITTATNATGATNYYYTPAQIDAAVVIARDSAYTRAISNGLTTAQATAAATNAETSLRNALNGGTEMEAAKTVAYTNTTTYLSSLGVVTNTAGLDFNAMQTSENVRVQTNKNSFSSMQQYVTANANTPTTNPATTLTTNDPGSLFKEESLTTRESLKNSMNGGNCSSCNYVKWDAWAKIIPDTISTSASAVKTKLVPYVYGGQLTNLGSLPSNVSATYNGNTSFNMSNATGIQTGTFTSNISLNTGSASISSFSFALPGGAGTLSCSSGCGGVNGVAVMSGTASFNGLSVNGNGYSATVNGSLFGPQADNIGGNINNINNGAGGVTGAGVFLGKR